MVWDQLGQQGVVPLTATTPSWTTSALPPVVSNAKALPQQATTDLNLVLIPPLIITRCLTDIHQDIHRRIIVRAVQALVPSFLKAAACYSLRHGIYIRFQG